MAFTFARYRMPYKACANNEKLNEHINESFYANENVMRLQNIVHHYFFHLR